MEKLESKLGSVICGICSAGFAVCSVLYGVWAVQAWKE